MENVSNVLILIGWVLSLVSTFSKDGMLKVRGQVCGLSVVCLGLQLRGR